MTVETIIAAAEARAAQYTQVAIAAAGTAVTAAGGRITPPAGSVITVPALRNDPPAFTPNMDLSAEFARNYQEAYADFDPEVLEAVLDYTARFFPTALATIIDDWLQNTIVNGGTGIPAAIENAIWERGRSRDLIEATRAEDDAVNAFAARGFSLPSGPLSARLLEVQREATNKISTFNRDVAIKAAEMEIENIKFAITEGLRVRLAVIGSIASYIKAWLGPAEAAVEYSKAIINAKDRLWNEASNYYMAMIKEAELGLRAQESTSKSKTEMVGLDVSSFNHYIDAQVKAAVAVATSLGSIAGGMLNAHGTSTQQAEQRVGPIV